MAVAHVQHVRNEVASATSVSATINGVAAGNLLVAYVFSGYSSTEAITVSDGTNTWVNASERVDDSERWGIWYAKNVASGNFTVTASGTVTPPGRGIVIHEISGCDTVAPLDVANTPDYQNAPGTGADAVTTGAIVTTADGCYVFAGVANIFQGQDFTTGSSGFTETTEAGAFAAPSESGAYKIQTSAGSITATWTANNGSGRMCSSIAAFKPAGGGGGESTDAGGMLLSSRRNRLTIP